MNHKCMPMLPGNRPGKNVCDPGMRNSQELSAAIKLICGPQAKACKHTARAAGVAEIGLPPTGPPLPLLASSESRSAASHANSTLPLLFLCSHFHISIYCRFPLPCCRFPNLHLSSLPFYSLFSTQPSFPFLSFPSLA